MTNLDRALKYISEMFSCSATPTYEDGLYVLKNDSFGVEFECQFWFEDEDNLKRAKVFFAPFNHSVVFNEDTTQDEALADVIDLIAVVLKENHKNPEILAWPYNCNTYVLPPLLDLFQNAGIQSSKTEVLKGEML